MTTFGESHGGGVGCVVDGVPPKLNITQEELQFELDRRRPGQSRITTPRDEADTCEILSGVGLDGVTLGTPMAVLVRNKDHRSQDYGEIAVAYRPSHADATYDMKYGVRAIAGGGRSSARETIGRVAAGAVAKKVLKQIAGTEILAYVSQVKDVVAEGVDHATVTMDDVEANIARCPNEASAERMIEAIDEVRVKGDSCGGVVTCIVRGCPRGLGAPVFDKLEADLAKAMMSLPATKGFEVGSGFDGVNTTGSEHNDEFYMDEETGLRTRTNRSGGSKAASPTARSSSSRSRSSPRPRSRARRTPSTATAWTWSSRRGAGTTPAWCPALCRWWRAWWRSCWWTTS